MLWKRIGNVFLAIGALLLLYLGYEEIRAFYLKQKLMSSMEALEVPIDNVTSKGTEAPKQETGKAGVELSIPKITLQAPVLEGTTTDILRVAIGHLAESGRLGVKGENFVLLGHRSSVTGRFFNRLDELAIGDIFTVTANGKAYQYEVMERKIISPTQLEVIQPREGESITTLITCHPKYSSKQRLVIVGKLL